MSLTFTYKKFKLYIKFLLGGGKTSRGSSFHVKSASHNYVRFLTSVLKHSLSLLNCTKLPYNILILLPALRFHSIISFSFFLYFGNIPLSGNSDFTSISLVELFFFLLKSLWNDFTYAQYCNWKSLQIRGTHYEFSNIVTFYLQKQPRDFQSERFVNKSREV